jgi:hypothetical protein
MRYKGFEIEHNPNDILFGANGINGEYEDGTSVQMFSIGLIFITITWIWDEKE